MSPRTNGFILIADSDRHERAAVAAALRRIGYTTREAASGEHALDACRRARPALVLLEVSLPGVSGYEVCRELRDQFGDAMPIIFISGERTESFDRVGGLLLGADDYIVKPFDPDELLARVRRFVTRPGPSFAATDPSHELTAREFEVLRLLAAGCQTSEIAHELVISPKTVGAHVQRILGKFGVHTQAQAVAKAYRERLVEPDPVGPAS